MKMYALPLISIMEATPESPREPTMGLCKLVYMKRPGPNPVDFVLAIGPEREGFAETGAWEGEYPPNWMISHWLVTAMVS